MKRVIIILSLIYFISCSSLCGDMENFPTKREECYQRESSMTENECCFLSANVSSEGSKITFSLCGEVPIGYNLEEFKKLMIQQLEEKGMQVNSLDIYCSSQDKNPDTSSSSYLKIGFLLILFFLL